MKKQVSETLSMGILLAVSGGLMDAYSYLFRDRVFANAQTGNILLFSVNLSQGNWNTALNYLCPVLAFACGIVFAAVVRHLCKPNVNLHWRQFCVLFEAVILFAVAWFPQSANLIANCLISLACAMQVESFRKIAGCGVATTMCIGNLRQAIHSAIEHGFTKSKSEQKSALVSTAIILAFAFGAVIGSILIHFLGTYAIWTSTIILLLCFVLMFGRHGSMYTENETDTEYSC